MNICIVNVSKYLIMYNKKIFHIIGYQELTSLAGEGYSHRSLQVSLIEYRLIPIYLFYLCSSVYEFGVDRIKEIYVKEIIKTGMLTKKGHKVKSMKDRFFVLVPQLMTYYEGKSEAGKRKGIVLITKV